MASWYTIQHIILSLRGLTDSGLNDDILQVGRPVVYGLAAMGEQGVRRVIEMLKDEFEITMALSGCPRVKDISISHVRTERDRLRSML